ncbi:glycosyltransferase family 2 protein [Lonepinella sp. BR2474]|uniref:glycosyltransferase family 2 protein n=1 Tax=Lonepinella sp. BR2474 TaxID=3434548 RepID=UPI003F6DC856
MICITMAGLSSRFIKAGYPLPKYALPLQNRTVFEWAVSTFSHYFHYEPFLFVIRPDDFAYSFVLEKVQQLGIVDYHIIRLNQDTKGQAETAYLALQQYHDDFPLTIFNIDTIRYDYIKPDFINDCDGYLEVFEGEGTHWSFVQPDQNQNVIRTTEKDRISNLCSDGLYFFKSQKVFCQLFEQALKNDLQVKGEFYIAPLYNLLIQQGKTVKYQTIKPHEIDFCGVPDEYEQLIKLKGQ